MDKRISSLVDAHQNYKDALTSVLAESIIADGEGNVNNSAMDLAIQNLNKQHELFLLECKNLGEMRFKPKLPSLVVQLMDEHISSLRYAHRTLKDALTAMLALFDAACGHRVDNKTIDSVIKNLNKQHEWFILACNNLRVFIDMRLPSQLVLLVEEPISSLTHAHKRFKDYLRTVLAELYVASGHHMKDFMESAIQSLNEQNEHFILACKRLRDFIHTNAVDPNTTDAPPVRPDNAQARDRFLPSSKGKEHMEFDTSKDGMSEAHKKTASQGLAGVDLNMPCQEETEENNKAALEEAASQVVPDLYPNEKT